MYLYERLELTSGETYRGARYLLSGFVEPEPGDERNFDPDQDAIEWGVSLARRDVWRDADGRVVHTDNVELCCLDTCHGGPHIDYRYVPATAERDLTVTLRGSWPYSKMRAFLLSNWRGLVDDARTYSWSGGPS